MTTLAVLLLLMCTEVLAAPSAITSPLSYSTTVTTPNGALKSVSFSGAANGFSLTGALAIDGISRQVSGTVALDGSVSGKLIAPDGSQAGIFWGRRDGLQGMKGSFVLNGEVGAWSVPIRVPLPSIAP